MSKRNDLKIMIHKKKFEVCFEEGLPERKHKRDEITYPEELLDKKCGGCMRCEPRDHAFKGKDAEGYHCTMQPYDKDINPDDKACVSYWDRAEEEEIKRLEKEDTENRRKELWAIYAKREPIKLPIVIDEFGGKIPQCPVCGEMPYSTEQCHWCGQRFIQDEEVEEYGKPDEWYEDCTSCGGKGTMHIVRSKYNGHKSGSCSACGMRWIE